MREKKFWSNKELLMNTHNRKQHILLVDDDVSLLRLLTMRLESIGYEVTTANNGKDGLGKLDIIRPDLVVSDLRMDQMDGFELHRSARRLTPYLPFIIMTAHGTIPDAVSATQEGVFAFITKPIDKDEFLSAVKKALKVSGGGETTINQTSQNPWNQKIITRSPIVKEIIEKAKLIADSNVRILLSGENGTGKELLARTIHENSKRYSAPFISVNCSVLNQENLEHEVLPKAEGGTLFLNEIDNISHELQVTLMRYFKSNEQPDEDSKHHNIRIISSSATDLKKLMKSGKFREDLFYCLSVVSFNLPKLSQRSEDIPLLARHFLKILSNTPSGKTMEYAPESIKMITDSIWPGNIRQLYHVIEQLVALSPTKIIPLSLVELALQGHDFETISFSEARSNFERDYLIRLLKISEGNVSKAAKAAKRNRTDFYKLLARNNIEPAKLKRNLFRVVLHD